MAQYLLAVHAVDGEPVPDDATVGLMYAQVGQFNGGCRRPGSGCSPAAWCPPMRQRWCPAGGHPGGDRRAADARGTQLGGFWVVEAADDDEARPVQGQRGVHGTRGGSALPGHTGGLTQPLERRVVLPCPDWVTPAWRYRRVDRRTSSRSP